MTKQQHQQYHSINNHNKKTSEKKNVKVKNVK